MTSTPRTHRLFIEDKDNLLRAIRDVEKKILKHHDISKDALEQEINTCGAKKSFEAFGRRIKEEQYPDHPETPGKNLPDQELPSVLYLRAYALRELVNAGLSRQDAFTLAIAERKKLDPDTLFSVNLMNSLFGHINNYQLLLLHRDTKELMSADAHAYTLGGIIKDQISILKSCARRYIRGVEPQVGVTLKILSSEKVYPSVRDYPTRMKHELTQAWRQMKSDEPPSR